MKTDIPAALAARAGIGDVFPALRPQSVVSSSAQSREEFLPAAGCFHGLLDHRHELKLPALALRSSSIFSWGELCPALPIGCQHSKTVGLTEFVAERAQLPQRAWVLPELGPGLKADAVDDEVGMDVRRVTVGGDQYLVARPCPCSKLPGDHVGFFIGHRLLRREGLDVLVEVHAILFSVDGLGQHEFLKGVFAVAVDAGHISAASGFGFLRLTAISQDPFHCADILSALRDERHCRHSLFSASSFRIRQASRSAFAASFSPGA